MQHDIELFNRLQEEFINTFPREEQPLDDDFPDWLANQSYNWEIFLQEKGYNPEDFPLWIKKY